MCVCVCVIDIVTHSVREAMDSYSVLRIVSGTVLYCMSQAVSAILWANCLKLGLTHPLLVLAKKNRKEVRKEHFRLTVLLILVGHTLLLDLKDIGVVCLNQTGRSQ